jgi:hypothetical protein
MLIRCPECGKPVGQIRKGNPFWNAFTFKLRECRHVLSAQKEKPGATGRAFLFSDVTRLFGEAFSPFR